MPVLFILYVLTLGCILAAGTRGRFFRGAPIAIALFLLIWANFVLTAQLLSLFSAMDSVAAYVAMSLILAVAASMGLRAIAPDQTISAPVAFDHPLSPRVARLVLWFLIGTGGLALLINIILAWGMLPANPDSIVYRFPRAYWYLSHGSLTHFSSIADPRVQYYPFNGTLLYVPLILFKLDPRAFSLPSLLCWLMVALTTYRFARDLGGPRLFAVATAWLICLTPNILLQALSTNDEILAAASLLAGLFFMHRWFRGRQTFDAVIGIIGMAISAGSKLHVTFYWPLLAGIAIVMAIHHRASLNELKSWLSGRKLAALLQVLALAGVFAFSFVVYNYLATGQATAWNFNDQVLNRPFNGHAAIQTIVLYIAQIVLTPVADLHVVFSSALRAQHYDAFNQALAPLFRWVDNGPAFTSANYRFVGVNSQSAAVFNEHTLFIGFTWLVAGFAGCWLALARWSESRIWPIFQLASLPVWLVMFGSSTRYIDGLSVYIGYATIVAAPASVFAFAPVRRPLLDRTRWGLLLLVAAAHCFFTGSIFLSSSPRNLILLLRAPEWPASRGVSIDTSVSDEIGRSPEGVVNRSITWGQPFWATMMYNPGIPQLLADARNVRPVPANVPADPDTIDLRYSRYGIMPDISDRRLQLFMFPQRPVYGQVFALRVPDLASPGLTWVGDASFSFGPEWVFAAGNGVELRHPLRNRYIAIKYHDIADGGRGDRRVIRVYPEVFGLGEKDDLDFRVEMKVGGKVMADSGWTRSPRFDAPAPDGTDATLTLLIRNNNAGGTVHATELRLRDAQPVQLSEAMK